MKFIKERKDQWVTFDVEYTANEFKMLLDYGRKNCPKKKQEELLFEWAVNDLLRRKVERVEGKNKR